MLVALALGDLRDGLRARRHLRAREAFGEDDPELPQLADRRRRRRGVPRAVDRERRREPRQQQHERDQRDDAADDDPPPRRPRRCQLAVGLHHSSQPERRWAAASASSGAVPARLLREVGREALVEELDRDVEDGAERLDEALGLGRLLAALPRSVSGRPTTTRSASSSRTSRASSASPLSVAGPLDDAERPRERAGRVGDGDAGARGAVVERHHLHAAYGATSSFAAASASAMPSGFLPPASRQRRLAAAAAADVLAELAHDLHGVEPARDERLVEVDDEERRGRRRPTRRSRRPPSPAGGSGRRGRAAARPSGSSPRRDDAASVSCGDDLRLPACCRRFAPSAPVRARRAAHRPLVPARGAARTPRPR